MLLLRTSCTRPYIRRQRAARVSTYTRLCAPLRCVILYQSLLYTFTETLERERGGGETYKGPLSQPLLDIIFFLLIKKSCSSSSPGFVFKMSHVDWGAAAESSQRVYVCTANMAAAAHLIHDRFPSAFIISTYRFRQNSVYTFICILYNLYTYIYDGQTTIYIIRNPQHYSIRHPFVLSLLRLCLFVIDEQTTTFFFFRDWRFILCGFFSYYKTAMRIREGKEKDREKKRKTLKRETISTSY